MFKIGKKWKRREGSCSWSEGKIKSAPGKGAALGRARTGGFTPIAARLALPWHAQSPRSRDAARSEGRDHSRDIPLSSRSTDALLGPTQHFGLCKFTPG